MKAKNIKSLKSILLSVFFTLSIYTGALLIYLYASGWRLDILNQEVKQTGVLTIESKPTLANIYIDDESKGRTDKSMTLDVGDYSIKVSKDGYYDWNKVVRILEERSTPVFPWLIKTEFEQETVFTSQKELVNYWIDSTDNHLLLLISDESNYEILNYNINTEFWELANNPLTILTIDKTIYENPNIDLNLSKSGTKALLTITTEEESKQYILPTNRVTNYQDLLSESINLTNFQDYSIEWSNTDNFLILESDEEVISYDINKGNKSLLLKKNNPLDKWSTDDQGSFYIFRHLETNEQNILKYSLLQYNLDGSNERVLISEVYFQNNTEYIQNYRSTGFDFGYFTNSPECTQAIGEITDFNINQKAKGIYISTTQSTYWYETTTGKYITVSPYPIDLVAYAPDCDKFIFKNSTYEIFTFDKEDGDHTVSIGSKEIDNLLFDQITDINWVSNSSYISFDEDNIIYITDIDGDNKTPLMQSDNLLYWTITSSRNHLITFSNIEGNIEIIQYQIH